MTVMKFGGSSLATAELLDHALGIAAGALADGVVLVASAMGGSTDRLQRVANLAGSGDVADAGRECERMQREHGDTARELLDGAPLAGALAQLDALFDELRVIVNGMSALRQWTPRSNDAVLGFGERAVTVLLAARARQHGIEARLLDSRELIVTDNHFMQANVRQSETAERIRAHGRPGRRQLLVAPGFIAATEDGIPTTLGRGGSDYTATLFGAALGAAEVTIWTDVTGIMTSDPRLVPDALTQPSISYREAAEMAYFGARVIHPATIQPAVREGIPVTVKNTRQPAAAGTRIAADGASGAKAIAYKRGITLINVTSSRMLLAYGFLRRIFEIFEHHRTPVDLVATSEVSVSMTIDDTARLDAIAADLTEIGAVNVDHDASLVSIVGQDLWEQPGFLATAVSALEGVPLKMMCLGSSDINLSLVVADAATETAVRSLHRRFFEG
ncbi:MAG: aspartate kinase [Spirochaetaceae bacterium]|nr:aspartate kinase [Spirochaetaceae bacterium]